VIVEGDEGYRQAKDFMKLLMPSHARRVKQYADAVSLFQRASVEDQLAAMYNPVVQLKSGGYLVINPTEALVSIDINSGRSTREHNIEQTATATNLEAAAEIARQLRLRDMAGLVVIDFIDMENNSNVRKVEKAMKEALKNDRARIQVGRISSFGLFEMSRQRLRTGVLEASTRQCPHCEGTGLVRTASSAGLSALRMLEDEAARGRGSRLLLRASQEAAFYVLNRKRFELAEIEERYGVIIEILPDGTLEGARMSVESGGPPPTHAPRLPAPIVIEADDEEDFVGEEEEEEVEETEAEAAEADREEERQQREGGDGEDRGDGRGRRRRRRRRRGGRGREDEGAAPQEQGGEQAEASDEISEEAEEAGERPVETEEEGEARRRRSRRGRRGGRRRGGEELPVAAETGEPSEVAEVAEFVEASEPEPVAEEAAKAPRPRRRPRARKDEAAVVEAVPAEVVAVEEAEPVIEVAVDEPVAKPKRTRRKTAVAAEPEVPAEDVIVEESVEAKPRRRARTKAAANDDVSAQTAAEVVMEPEIGGDAASAQTEEEGPPRRGWWQRTFGN
jgi:ribonuclease E